MNIEFKFELDQHVTTFDGQEGVVDAQCIDREGIFYSLKKRYHKNPGLRMNYHEQELTAGWENYQHEKNDLEG